MLTYEQDDGWRYRFEVLIFAEKDGYKPFEKLNGCQNYCIQVENL